ncbi:dihydrofolate reductase family protein [Nocardioides jensenii]|uniref:dihydrofolate reductase family protein n=1 Tax=Nocardioides jensenii TaxID=1843 RepID=UPI000834746E|nr:dihydrofolate reductase family protein [Nocardioides jensenii]
MGLVHADLGITLDGYSAGPNQRLEQPFGDFPVEHLHSWMFEHGDENAAEVAAIVDAGAFVMGRNMFTAGRGEHDPEWKGWWGDNPPYHGPVFVVSHHARESIPMEGGSTFHFVTDGVESAMAQAKAQAGDRNVSVTGGARTVNQCLALGLIDELRLHVVPFTAGDPGDEGSRVFAGVPQISLEIASVRSTPHVNHLTYRRPGL